MKPITRTITSISNLLVPRIRKKAMKSRLADLIVLFLVAPPQNYTASAHLLRADSSVELNEVHEDAKLETKLIHTEYNTFKLSRCLMCCLEFGEICTGININLQEGVCDILNVEIDEQLQFRQNLICKQGWTFYGITDRKRGRYEVSKATQSTTLSVTTPTTPPDIPVTSTKTPTTPLPTTTTLSVTTPMSPPTTLPTTTKTTTVKTTTRSSETTTKDPPNTTQTTPATTTAIHSATKKQNETLYPSNTTTTAAIFTTQPATLATTSTTASLTEILFDVLFNFMISGNQSVTYCDSTGYCTYYSLTVVVCYEAKGDGHGSFKAPRTGKVVLVILKHLKGSISCFPGYSSYWFCEKTGTGKHVGILLTDKENKRIDFNGAFTETRPDVFAFINKAGYKVLSGDEMRIWFYEDIENFLELDNTGQHCVHVYLTYEPPKLT